MKTVGNTTMVRIGFILLLLGSVLQFFLDLPYIYSNLWSVYLEIVTTQVVSFLFLFINLAVMSGVLLINGLFRTRAAIIIGAFVIIATIPQSVFQVTSILDRELMSSQLISASVVFFYLGLLVGAVFFFIANRGAPHFVPIIPFLIHFASNIMFSLVIHLPFLRELFEPIMILHGMLSIMASVILGAYSIIAIIIVRSAEAKPA